jgi:hypothetical protein
MQHELIKNLYKQGFSINYIKRELKFKHKTSISEEQIKKILRASNVKLRDGRTYRRIPNHGNARFAHLED